MLDFVNLQSCTNLTAVKMAFSPSLGKHGLNANDLAQLYYFYGDETVTHQCATKSALPVSSGMTEAELKSCVQRGEMEHWDGVFPKGLYASIEPPYGDGAVTQGQMVEDFYARYGLFRHKTVGYFFALLPGPGWVRAGRMQFKSRYGLDHFCLPTPNLQTRTMVPVKGVCWGRMSKWDDFIKFHWNS